MKLIHFTPSTLRSSLIAVGGRSQLLQYAIAIHPGLALVGSPPPSRSTHFTKVGATADKGLYRRKYGGNRLIWSSDYPIRHGRAHMTLSMPGSAQLMKRTNT
jgi:hypothetical protein